MDTTSTDPGLKSYVSILRRRGVYVAVIAPVFILLAVYLAFALTPLYEATATILLEPSSVDAKTITTTVTTYSNQQIEIVQGRVMTMDTLKTLVKEYDPYPGGARRSGHVETFAGVERLLPSLPEPR
jgi:polysaccharide biosynthesis transport protein